MDKYKSKFFNDSEIRCKCGCGSKATLPGWLEAMDNLRADYGAMIITSFCRCTIHNEKVGGKPASYHISDGINGGNCAADIKIESPIARAMFVKLALIHNMSVGINDKFIHIDGRSKLLGLKQIVFLY